MKKILMSTSAIALIGAFSAGQAAAAEWNMRVGGYGEYKVGYSNVDADASGDFDGFDAKQDSEIWFLPSITLDNGLKFGVNIQLEGDTSSDQIDENYLTISGSFGQVLIGSENSAGYKMAIAAPDVSFFNVNSGDQSNWMPIVASGGLFRNTLGSTYIETGGNNDAQRLTYFTPRFAGLQLGASYARDGRQDDQSQINTDNVDDLHDIWDLGANYTKTFSGVSIAASGHYGSASGGTGQEDPDMWSTGLNLGYAGFTVGGSYAKQNDDGANTGKSWDAGISYATGPWGVSLTYLQGKADGDVGGGDEELKSWQGAVAYALGPGVDLNGVVGYSKFNDDNSAVAGGDATDDDADAWYVATGVKVSF